MERLEHGREYGSGGKRSENVWECQETGLKILLIQRRSAIMAKIKNTTKVKSQHVSKNRRALIPNESNNYLLIQIILLENLVNEISHKENIYINDKI